jgi:hypothetical protein
MTYLNTKRKIQTSLKRGNEFAVVSIPKLFLDNWSQLLEGRQRAEFSVISDAL